MSDLVEKYSFLRFCKINESNLTLDFFNWILIQDSQVMFNKVILLKLFSKTKLYMHTFIL